MIQLDRLRELVIYDPHSGFFHRRKTGKVAGGRRPDGYVQVSVDGKRYYAHRLAWFYVYGEWPELIDHINRNPTDNRIENLRQATWSENLLNSKLRIDNTSGHTGVAQIPSGWRAYINYNGSQLHLGVFRRKEDAAAAATQWRST